MCEECKTCNVRTGRPVVAGQSDPLFVPSVMKTHILVTDDPAQEEDLLQRYKERIEKLSQQDRVIKICTDAGFLTTVEVGQYFMTKDTEEFSPFSDSVACREYTLPTDGNLSEPKGWIRESTKIGPVLEVTTCCLQGKYGVEIGIESMNKDHSHSWVRTSHGLNKLVTDLINREYDDDEQETSTTKTEGFAFASRSKAEAKPRRPTSACSSTRTVPIREQREDKTYSCQLIRNRVWQVSRGVRIVSLMSSMRALLSTMFLKVLVLFPLCRTSAAGRVTRRRMLT